MKARGRMLRVKVDTFTNLGSKAYYYAITVHRLFLVKFCDLPITFLIFKESYADRSLKSLTERCGKKPIRSKLQDNTTVNKSQGKRKISILSPLTSKLVFQN